MNDTSMPLISILIPAYNHEKYVAECVHSVMAQDWPRMELLIVDDGSNDGTWAEVRRLSDEASASGRFERVEIATQTNRGTCETLNRLCSMASGDIVAIIASDDKYLPGAFAALMKPMAADPLVGVSVGQNGFMDGDGRECFWDCNQNVVYDASKADCRTFNEHLRRLSGVEDNGEGFGNYENLLRCNHIANGYLIRRAFLKRVLPFNREAPLEDHWLHLQLSKICRYRAVPEMTFRYRWHAGNTIRQSGRMIALRYRTLKHEERMTGRPIVTERMRFSLGTRDLLSIRKIETLEEKRKVLRVFGRDLTVKRKPLLADMELRCLAIVHVYYSEIWPELSECLRSIHDPCDVVITYCDETRIEEAKRDFPNARFLRCENVGYDVWPFVAALQSVNLDDYDVVIKLHTKRDMPVGLGARPFNGFLVDGSRWRDRLLRFIRTPETWTRTKKRLADPRVGMVADRWVIAKEKGVRFVAGTMFAVKACLLKAFQSKTYAVDRFAPSDGGHMGTFAHECEREFGRVVEKCGLTIVGIDEDAVSFRLLRMVRCVWSFVYRDKIDSSGRRLIKIMKIPICRSAPAEENGRPHV